MSIPANLRYTKDHEWILLEGDIATVGITDFAQSELGEIVFADLPAIGKKVGAGEPVCVLESTKAASDVYAPISGTVKEVNSALTSDPTSVNSDPYKNGWLVKLSGINAAELEPLMNADAYKQHIQK